MRNISKETMDLGEFSRWLVVDSCKPRSKRAGLDEVVVTGSIENIGTGKTEAHYKFIAEYDSTINSRKIENKHYTELIMHEYADGKFDEVGMIQNRLETIGISLAKYGGAHLSYDIEAGKLKVKSPYTQFA